MSHAHSLHEAILETLRAERLAVYRRAHLVLELQQRGLVRELGYASMRAYASDVLDMGSSKLRALLRLAREAPKLPAVEDAVRDGSIAWTKAVEVLRVATPDTAAAWIERARNCTSRELERQARGSDRGEPPPDPDELGPPRRRRSWMLEARHSDLADRVIALLRMQTGLADEDLDDGRLIGLALERAAQVLEAEAEDPPTEPIYRTVVTQCPTCYEVSSPDHLVMDHVAAAAADDGELLDLTEGPGRGRISRTIPARTRRAVLARDAYRCVFPGCTCTLRLQLHHGEPFARRPDHAESSLFTLCSAHHAAVHEGSCGLFEERCGRWSVVHRGGRVEPARVGLGEPSRPLRARRRSQRRADPVRGRAPPTPA